jgi:E3 ubiquitin-protein ligase DOA10
MIYISMQMDNLLFEKNNIKDVESQYNENYEEKECRICLESSGDFIVICDCKGSCKYVHKECIETWINSFPKEHKKHNVCDICNSNYKLELIKYSDDTKKILIGITTFLFILFILLLFVVITLIVF